MRVTYHGVRGSIARAPTSEEVVGRLLALAAGQPLDEARLKSLLAGRPLLCGGNTSCTLVEGRDGDLVIDAGTGLRALSGRYLKDPARPVHLLLSHVHWDHVQGIPFFVPVFLPGREVHIHSPLPPETVRAALATQMNPPVFPVPFGALPSKITFHRMGERERIAGLEVASIPLEHPQGSWGFRVEEGGRAYAHLTDVELALLKPADHARYRSFLAGARLVAGDTQYNLREASLGCRGWGHSTVQHFVELLAGLGAGTFLLFHHNPGLDERGLDVLLEQGRAWARLLGQDLRIELAAEGMTHEV